MADPLTMAATAVKVVGSTIGAVGKYQTAHYNAALADQAATQERQFSSIEAENRQREGEKAVGSAIAQGGAAGISLGGSASDVIAQIASENYQGARTAVFDGLLRGRALNTQANNERREGRQALTAAAFKVGGTVLAGASQYKFNKARKAGSKSSSTGKGP